MMTVILFAFMGALVWVVWFVGWMLLDSIIDFFNNKED